MATATDPDAPWPSMRGGPANLGRARVHPEPRAWPIRSFSTGGPVFSTPVVGEGEQIYVGSADHFFYRMDPASGEIAWRFETDEVIDSAACIGADGTLWVPGGDGRIYALDPSGKELWRYDRMRDRTRATPSTIYWWEGNIAFGPNGWLYAGNDDFYLYAIEPFAGVRWATPTGLHIWGAPAFDGDLVFAASFDRRLYALDARTGRERWSCNLGNFLASSPAVAEGLVIVGSFDHHVSAVDASSGRVVWRTSTGGPVYASAAVDGDQVVIGSGDGAVYAMELRTGAVRWARWLGDAIRGSIGVGEHLYVPGGDGRIHALGRDGRLRWRHDTRRPGTLYNLNASVALGRHGLATASASGDVIYVPYGAVADAQETRVERDGCELVVVGSGGTAGEAVGPQDVVGVQVLHTEGGVTTRGRILAANAPICPDGSQMHLVADPGAQVRARGTYQAAGATYDFDQELAIRWIESGAGSLPEAFRVRRIAVQAPSIVPSFDQIGLASLSIDVGVLARDGDRVVAWGVQRFGMDEQGCAVGVPEPRILYYAFDGSWKDGTLVLESGACLFEITAFPVPLTRLRLVAHLRGGDLAGGSLVAEADARAALRAIPSLLPDGAWARIRRWLPERPRLRDFADLARILRRMLPLGLGLARGLARPWRLVDAQGHFHGVGGFEAAPMTARTSTLELLGARIESRHVVATWRGGEAADAPGILLMRAGRPVSWPYALRMRTLRRDGAPVRTELDVRGAEWDEAWVLRDLERVACLPRP